MEFEIKKLGINGEGIGYYKRKPVFIDNALPTEIVEARIVENHKTYYRARLGRIKERSKERVIVTCPYYEDCGACQVMHLEYDAQLRYKVEGLKEALRKYAGIKIEDIKIIGSDKTLAYRNSLKLPVYQDKKGKLQSGLYKEGTDHLVYIKDCLVHDKTIERVKKNIINVLNKYGYKDVYGLYIRQLDKVEAVIVTGDIKIDETCINDLMRIEGLKSLYQSIKNRRSHEFFGKMILLKGERAIAFDHQGLKLKIAPTSFFQLNTQQATKLYQTVIAMCDEDSVVFEAYAGIATMSLALAKKAKRVIASEVIPSAIADAKAAARANDIKNGEFILGDSAETLKRYSKKEKIDILIVDPPRSGLSQEMIKVIERSEIKKMIYVSCNPSTLAKDLALLDSYKIKDIVAFDMFPQTMHVETVVLMSRVKGE